MSASDMNTPYGSHNNSFQPHHLDANHSTKENNSGESTNGNSNQGTGNNTNVNDKKLTFPLRITK